MRIVMLGPPGAGKGTQATLLAQRQGVPRVASGDLFRRHQREGTPLGVKAMEYMNQGLLVPDDITIAMVLEDVASPVAFGAFVLDGFPRNLNQARSLEEALAYHSTELDRAILIEVSEEELVSRLSQRQTCGRCQDVYHAEANPPKVEGICDRCGATLERRADDTPQATRKRSQVYQEETASLVEYYRERGKLVMVSGMGSVDEVKRRIEKKLGCRLFNEAGSS